MTLQQNNILDLVRPQEVFNSESKGFFNSGFRFLPDVMPETSSSPEEKSRDYRRYLDTGDTEVNETFDNILRRLQDSGRNDDLPS